MIRLLIVDDEPAVLSALRRELRGHFGEALAIETCAEPGLALARLREQAFDIVISDLRMPEIDGISLLTVVSALLPRSVRIVLTGSADLASAQRAIADAGVFRYLTKPWSQAELRSHVAAAMAQCAAAAAPGLTVIEWADGGIAVEDRPRTSHFRR